MKTMFATVEGRVLARAVKDVMRVIQFGWVSYPMLGRVHLRCEGSTLWVTGTDLDVEISRRIDLNDAAGTWAVAIEPRALVAVARIAGPALVTMVPEGDDLQVLQDQLAEYTLSGLGASEFPRLEGAISPLIEAFPEYRLAELIRKVAPCVSKEETRYYLNGVAWQFGPFGRRFVATDGHRLALNRYDDTAAEPVTRVIPTVAVNLLLNLVNPVAVHGIARPEAGGLHFDAGDTIIRTKLIDVGTHGYPDVERVIPRADASAGDLNVTRNELMHAAVRALALSLRRWDTGNTLKLQQGSAGLQVSAKHDENGTAKIAVRGTWPEGAPAFGVSGHYLMSILNLCGPGLRIRLTKGGGPLLFVDDDTAMTRLLMPMRVD